MIVEHDQAILIKASLMIKALSIKALSTHDH